MLYTDEIWKTIDEFEDYAISNYGRLKRLTIGKGTVPGRILTPNKNNCGYLFYTFKKNKKAYARTIHRLVALAFIENPNNYSDVDHIDGNKLNNQACNLQWLSHKDNVNKMMLEKGEEIKEKRREKFKQTIATRNFNYKIYDNEVLAYKYDSKYFKTLYDLKDYLCMTLNQTKYFCMKSNIRKTFKVRKSECF